MEAGILELPGGKKVGGEDSGVPLGIGSERQGRLQRILCYRVGDETGDEGVRAGNAEGEVKICCEVIFFPGRHDN